MTGAESGKGAAAGGVIVGSQMRSTVRRNKKVVAVMKRLRWMADTSCRACDGRCVVREEIDGGPAWRPRLELSPLVRTRLEDPGLGGLLSPFPFGARGKKGNSMVFRQYCAVLELNGTLPTRSPSRRAQPLWVQGPITSILIYGGLWV